ncbi:winged helix-turn-helix transcriptional regulator [uncultured Jatrophihabitans sp.]|uniref:winged helix-turn-helix transcriptional regulator n=1 Tax=uncultured Jatrophihabitans sp. TaxID=1610747 RepID=UPI0035CBA2A4
MSEDTARLTGALSERSGWRADRCPIARSLGVVGTRSAMLIMREAYYGTTRFDDFADRVGITQAVAAARLRELTDAGLLRREPYQDPGQRTRFEYRLTEMGRDLAPAVLGLFDWGSKYLFGDRGAPLTLQHTDCGADIHVTTTCSEGHVVPLRDMSVTRT